MLAVEERVKVFQSALLLPSSSAITVVRFHLVPCWLADFMQLLLMSCCDHHIVANSSFSWWAAFLHQTLAETARGKEKKEDATDNDNNSRKRGGSEVVGKEDKKNKVVVAYPAFYSPPPVNRRPHQEQYYPKEWHEVDFSPGTAWMPPTPDDTSEGGSGVKTSVAVAYPPNGGVVSTFVTPVVKVGVGDDAVGAEIKTHVDEWDLCLELDGRSDQLKHGDSSTASSERRLCLSLAKPVELPAFEVEPGSGSHEFKAYLLCNRNAVSSSSILISSTSTAHMERGGANDDTQASSTSSEDQNRGDSEQLSEPGPFPGEIRVGLATSVFSVAE